MLNSERGEYAQRSIDLEVIRGYSEEVTFGTLSES
jgi:hypothetical protein